jgi:hypothetical protein
MTDATPSYPKGAGADSSVNNAAPFDPVGRLHELVDGLTYSSEGDHPFEIIDRTVPEGERWTSGVAADARTIRRLLSLAPTCPVHVMSIERVLGRHTVFTDPADQRAQCLRPRYEAMQQFLETCLHDVIGVHTGQAPTVDVWLVGFSSPTRLLGYHTIAIET